jgi:hypothetical protein
VEGRVAIFLFWLLVLVFVAPLLAGVAHVSILVTIGLVFLIAARLAARWLGGARASAVALWVLVVTAGAAALALGAGPRTQQLAWFARRLLMLPALLAFVAWPAIAIALLRAPEKLSSRIARTFGGALIVGTFACCSMALVKQRFRPDPAQVRRDAAEICEATYEEGCKAEELRIDVLSEVGNYGYHFRLADPRTGESAEFTGGLGRLWHVPALKLWFFEDHRALNPSDGFVGPPFERHPQTYASFARELAPPRAWTWSALLGLVVALLTLRPRRGDRTLLSRLTWREELRPDGPVLVSPPSAPSYRASGREGEQVVPGTHAAVRAEIARLRLDRWMFAIAALLLLGAPLLTAATMGFLRW